MSKRTLILIVFLLIITGVFVYIAVSQKSMMPSKRTNMAVTPSPSPVPAYTTLMLSPQTLSLSSKSGSIAVEINTKSGGKNNTVTAVQLELQYDPKMLTNVTVTPGTFIPSAAPLINTIDKITGRITYALAISPSAEGVSGSGTVATIQFQSLLAQNSSTQLTLLPSSLVTAQGVGESVLLQATSATISTSSTPAMSTSSPSAR